MPDVVSAEEGDGWLANMKTWKEEMGKYTDFIFEVQNYAEFYTGNVKGTKERERDKQKNRRLPAQLTWTGIVT